MGKIKISEFHDNCGFLEGVEVLSEKTVDNSRWSISKEYVLKLPDGRKIMVYREVGATEMQCEDSWDPYTLGYREEIDYDEVELKEVIVKKWVPV